MEATHMITQYKEFIQDYYKTILTNNLMKDKPYLEIDVRKLAKFDPEIVQELLDNPQESIKACEIAISEVNQEKSKPIEALFNNLPKSTYTPLNEISNQLNKFMTFEGIVMKPSEVFLKCYQIRYECSACGNLITIIMLGNKMLKPKKCGCGAKTGFKVLSKEYLKFQRLELHESLSTIPDKPYQLTKKKVTLSRTLADPDRRKQLQPGQKVLIHGFLELEEIRRKLGGQSNEFKVNIIANNIIPIPNSWESIKLDAKTKTKLELMAKNENLLDEFAHSISPTFEGYMDIRRSLILQHVCGKRLFNANGNLEERGVIHILLCGNPSSGKSFLTKRSAVISPLWQWTTGPGLTAAGLVACVVHDEAGGFTLEVGPLPLADKEGTCVIDELNLLPKEYFGVLNNSMNDEMHKINKGNINQPIQTRSNVLATSNPVHIKFTDDETIIKQLKPIPKTVLDRFDLIWAMRENIDQDLLDDKYLDRHLQNDNTKQTWSNEEMQLYIAYAKRIVPILTREVAIYYKQKYRELAGGTTYNKNKDSEDQHSKRLRGNIFRLIYAHAKFWGVGNHDKKTMQCVVTKPSVDFAFGLLKYSFKLLGIIDELGFTKFELLEDIPAKKEINKFYLVKNKLIELRDKFDNKIYYNKLLEAINKERDVKSNELDDILVKLKTYGDIYFPRGEGAGIISLI